MLIAASKGFTDIIQILMKDQTDEREFKRLLMKENSKDQTGKDQTGKDQKTNFAAKDQTGKTALMLAAEHGKTDVVEMLLDVAPPVRGSPTPTSGTDINKQNSFRKSGKQISKFEIKIIDFLLFLLFLYSKIVFWFSILIFF